VLPVPGGEVFFVVWTALGDTGAHTAGSQAEEIANPQERTEIVIFRLEPAFSGTPDEQLALDRQKTYSMKIIDGLAKNGGPQFCFGTRYRCVDFEGVL